MNCPVKNIIDIYSKRLKGGKTRSTVEITELLVKYSEHIARTIEKTGEKKFILKIEDGDAAPEVRDWIGNAAEAAIKEKCGESTKIKRKTKGSRFFIAAKINK